MFLEYLNKVIKKNEEKYGTFRNKSWDIFKQSFCFGA